MSAETSENFHSSTRLNPKAMLLGPERITMFQITAAAIGGSSVYIGHLFVCGRCNFQAED